MAPNLIPFGPEGLSAVYDTAKRVLIVRADGSVDSFWFGAFLKKDPNFVGGLKFLLLGFPGGLAPVNSKPKEPLAVQLDLHISLPQEYFHSSSVVIQTGSGTFPDIPIRYTGLLPPGDKTSLVADSDTKDAVSKLNALKIGDVLPPIDKWLPEGAELTLTARIPDETQSRVDISFNPEYLQLTGSGVVNGDISWKLKWVKFPVGDANPQLVEVETDRGIQLPPPNPITSSQIIQGYVVYGAFLNGTQTSKK